MTDKQAVREVLDRLPEQASLEEITEELQIMAAIRCGRADLAAGRAKTHDEVRQIMEFPASGSSTVRRCLLALVVILGLSVLWLMFFNTRNESDFRRKPTARTLPALIRPGPPESPKTPVEGGEFGNEVDDGLWGWRKVDPSKPQLTFQMLGTDWKLSSHAIDYAGVPDEKLKVVQGHIDRMRAELETLTKNHARRDLIRDDPEKGISAFVIKTYPEEGTAVRTRLKQKLEAELGTEIAGRLLESFGWTNIFAACGKQEVLAQFTDIQTPRGPLMTARWQLLHPQTGKVMSETSGPYELWVQKFGNALEIDDTSDQ